MKYLSFLLVLMVAVGCHAKQPVEVIAAPEKPSAPEVARDAVQGQLVLSNAVYLFGEWVTKFPGESIPKVQINDQWLLVKSACDAQTKIVATVPPAVIASEKEKEKLREQIATLQEPEKAMLRDWGIWTIVGGVGLLALYFAAGFIPVVGPWIQKGGQVVMWLALGAIGVGFTLVTLERFLTQIEWIIAGTLAAAFLTVLVAVVVYVWRNHQQITKWVAEEAATPPATSTVSPAGK